MANDELKKSAAESAPALVEDDMVVGVYRLASRTEELRR